MQREEGASVLDNAEVDSNDDEPDNDEGGVGEEVLAQVQLVVNLPSSDHVDNLEPDEKVEDEGHVAGGVTIDHGKINDSIVEIVTVKLKEAAGEHIGVIGVSLVAHKNSQIVESVLLLRLGDHVLTTEEEDE